MESPSRRNRPCRHLDFRLLASRKGENKFLLLEATPFVATCYSSPGKLISGWNVDHVKNEFHLLARAALELLQTEDTASASGQRASDAAVAMIFDQPLHF